MFGALAMYESDALEDYRIQERIIKDRIRGVVHRLQNGVYIHGRPGTGKTYTIRTTLEGLAVPYTYKNGHLTYAGFFDLLDENHDRIVVIDDVSALFNQPIALQYMLAALGNTHDGSRTRVVKRKTRDGEHVVYFTGGLVMASNLPLEGHHQRILAALRDRINVINFEPSDECIIAVLCAIASGGVGGVAAKNCLEVADFLVTQSRARGLHPSVRQFVNKAVKDFALWQAGNTETHWKDLMISMLEQQTAVDLEHPQRDLSRKEQIETERRIVADIIATFATIKERVQQWKALTGKSQAAFYRRMKELEGSGQLAVTTEAISEPIQRLNAIWSGSTLGRLTAE
jgi:hypothetical protein